mgnify:CR=1 FL=1
MGKLTFIIAGGGTGGHLYPALAIGAELNNQEAVAYTHMTLPTKRIVLITVVDAS